MNAFSDYADFIKTLPDANPWQGTPFESFYNFPPKKKGVAGEEIVKQMLYWICVQTFGNTILNMEMRLHFVHRQLILVLPVHIEYYIPKNMMEQFH